MWVQLNVTLNTSMLSIHHQNSTTSMFNVLVKSPYPTFNKTPLTMYKNCSTTLRGDSFVVLSCIVFDDILMVKQISVLEEIDNEKQSTSKVEDMVIYQFDLLTFDCYLQHGVKEMKFSTTRPMNKTSIANSEKNYLPFKTRIVNVNVSWTLYDWDLKYIERLEFRQIIKRHKQEDDFHKAEYINILTQPHYKLIKAASGDKHNICLRVQYLLHPVSQWKCVDVETPSKIQLEEQQQHKNQEPTKHILLVAALVLALAVSIVLMGYFVLAKKKHKKENLKRKLEYRDSSSSTSETTTTATSTTCIIDNELLLVKVPQTHAYTDDHLYSSFSELHQNLT